MDNILGEDQSECVLDERDAAECGWVLVTISMSSETLFNGSFASSSITMSSSKRIEKRVNKFLFMQAMLTYYHHRKVFIFLKHREFSLDCPVCRLLGKPVKRQGCPVQVVHINF